MKLSRIEKIIKKNSWDKSNYVQSDGQHLYWNDCQTFIKFKDQNLPLGFYHYKTLETRELSGIELDSKIVNNPSINEITVMKVKDLELLLKHASKDETRLFLCAVNFHGFDAVATNGYHLRKIELTNNLNGSYLVPREGIEYLLKCLSIASKISVINLNFSEGYLTVFHDQFECSIRLIDREYIKWQGVWPKRFNYTCQVTNWIDYKDVKKLLNERKTVSLIGIKNDLMLKIDAGTLFKIGKCTHDFEIGFNCSFLELASEGKKQFEIRFNNELAPCKINEAIVMPIKL